jgi:PEP-CTERM motif-containing protein
MVKLATTMAMVSGLAIFGAVGAANAAALFTIEANPSQKDMLKLSDLKDAKIDVAHVDGTSDTITANAFSDFSSGDATIKPIKGATLTDLSFTPSNDLLFSDFSWRGQDVNANQTLTVTVTDQNGATQVLTFQEGKANEDFARQGIIAAMAGETIKSVDLSMSGGGFKEAKQFAFSLAPGVSLGVPEPASWALMVLGVGLVGAGLRVRHVAPRQALG